MSVETNDYNISIDYNMPPSCEVCTSEPEQIRSGCTSCRSCCILL